MWNRCWRLCAFLLTTALFLLPCRNAAADTRTDPTGHHVSSLDVPSSPYGHHIVDTSDRLTHDAYLKLDAYLHEIQRTHGRQISVLILSSLNGETIEDVAYTTAKQWGIGRAGDDDGVLLVVALDERRIRIEVGKGVEGQLPDLKCSDIIGQSIAPRLREGDPVAAIEQGADAIAMALGDAPADGNAESVGATDADHTWPPILAGIIMCLLVALCFRNLYVRRRDQPFECRGEGTWGLGDEASPSTKRISYGTDSSSTDWPSSDDGASFAGSSSIESSSDAGGGDSLGDSFGGGDFGGGGASGDF